MNFCALAMDQSGSEWKKKARCFVPTKYTEKKKINHTLTHNLWYVVTYERLFYVNMFHPKAQAAFP